MEALAALHILVSLRDMFSAPALRMRESLRSIGTVAQNASGRIKTFAQNTQKAGIKLAGFGAAGVIGVRSLLKPFREVQDEAALLQTVWTATTGTVQESVGDAVREARDWARVNSDTAAEFLRASFLMASAGLKDVEAIAGTKAALQTATATKGEAAAAANLLASVYNNLGDKSADAATELGLLGDKISKTQQFFQFKDLAQLEASLSHAAGTTLTYGVKLNDVLAIMGQLNTTFLQGSNAGTQYGATLRNLFKAADKLQFDVAKNADGGIDFIGTLANIRAKFGLFEDMSDGLKVKFQQAFGTRGVNPIALLLPHVDRLRDGLGAVDNALGTNKRSVEILSATLSSKIQVAMNRFDEARAQFAEAFIAPQVERWLVQLGEVIAGVREWTRANPELAGTLAQVVLWATLVSVVLAPVLFAMSGLASVAGMVASVFGGLSNLGNALAVGLGVLGAAAKVVLVPLKLLTVALFRVGFAILYALTQASPLFLLGTIIAAAVTLAIVYWDKLEAVVKTKLQAIGRWIDDAGAALALMWEDATDTVADWFESLASLPERAADWATNLARGWLDDLASMTNRWVAQGTLFVESLWNGMKLAWSDFESWFKGKVNGLTDLVPDFIVDLIASVAGPAAPDMPGERALLRGGPSAAAMASPWSHLRAPERQRATLPTITVEAESPKGEGRIGELMRTFILRADAQNGRAGTTINIDKVEVQADNAEDFTSKLQRSARENG